jgi:N-acetylmuramoyl-L-alanine amidase
MPQPIEWARVGFEPRCLMGFARSAANASCIVLVLLCAAAAPAESAAARLSVRDVRYRTSSDHTRVVLDMSGAPRYSVRMVSYPYRIVIDIPACHISERVQDREVRDGVLDRIRVNRVKTGAQIVLDLPRSSEFNHFPLQPGSGKPHRIVIDIIPSSTREEATRDREGAPEVSGGGGRVVIIDPGHGGDKPGTHSRSGLQEKTLVMKLARLLKAELERRAGYRAILVRDGDYDVAWYRRVTMARENGGDVFMSLHFNAHPDPNTRGIELYFLSMEGASDKNAEAVAEQENLLLEVGADSAHFNDDLKSILFDVSRSNAMQRSSLFAEEVASAVQKGAPIPFRRVKQANFIVLRGMVPSILVEGGYLSNRKDASIIGKESYLRWLAKTLADGVANFLEKHPNADTARDTR